MTVLLRQRSRQMVVQALFIGLARHTDSSIKDLEYVFYADNQSKENEFSKELFTLVIQHLGMLKVLIKVYAPSFTFDKMAIINRALLLSGLAEMRFMDTPVRVILNEYIEIAKHFGEEGSAKFINAVLDNYRINIKKEALEAPTKTDT